MDLAAATLETFLPHVDSRFALDGPHEGVALTLESATPAGERAAAERAPFRLVFRGPSEPLLPQSIYRLEHGGLGALEIFVVPVAQDADGTSYEAIFS